MTQKRTHNPLITVDAPQGSAEWHEARLGVVTASRMRDAMSRSRDGSLSDTAMSYVDELVQEMLTGEADTFEAEATEHGKASEDLARSEYEMLTGATTRTIGLVYLDETRRVGASPDFLVDPDGGGEIKCPHKRRIHQKTLRTGLPNEHIPQIQGNMWITRRLWWDFVSHHSSFPPPLDTLIIRVMRDDEYIREMRRLIEEFIAVLSREYLAQLSQTKKVTTL